MIELLSESLQGVRMPKAKNKKNAFIDKRNSTSFHLVHRSQKVGIDLKVLVSMAR